MEGARKDGGWEGGSKGREGEGAREAVMTLCRERTSVEEGGLREGRLMKGITKKGRNEAWTAQGKVWREEASGGGIERGREGALEQGREGNFKGGSIFTNQPFTNRPLPLPLRLW